MVMATMFVGAGVFFPLRNVSVLLGVCRDVFSYSQLLRVVSHCSQCSRFLFAKNKRSIMAYVADVAHLMQTFLIIL